ncbi:MAG: hypothetical protein AAF804_12350 [Bacteroidota bacterium]
MTSFQLPRQLRIGLAPLLLLTVVGAEVYVALQQSGGTWVFPLDDSYIHLSIARQLAEHGTWALSEGRPAFAASSPGFDLLLAGFHRLSMASEGLLLCINALAGIMIGILAWRWTPSHRHKPWLWLASMLILPLHLLVLLGMEHTLHILLVMAFLRCYSQDRVREMVILAALATLLRYESIFVLFPVSLDLLFRGRFKLAAWQMILPLALVSCLGFWSYGQGSSFLPSSLLLKGYSPLEDPLLWLESLLSKLYDNPFMLTLGLALSLGMRVKDRSQPLLRISLLALGLHLAFAEVGGFRYEAYLLAMGLYSLAQLKILPTFPRPARLSQGLFLSLLLFPWLIRTMFFSLNYPLACANIHQQPYQLAQFLKAYYPGEEVAVNDIGLATYIGKIALTDLVGLGDQAVLALRQNQQYQAQAIDSLARSRGLKIAVFHPDWIAERRPKSWTWVGSWTIANNFILAGDSLGFYAVSPRDAVRLRTQMKAFTPALPASVSVHIGPSLDSLVAE